MKNLLKADFLRIKKDLLLKIALIGALAMSFLTALIYFGLSKIANIEDTLGMLPDGKYLFATSFITTSNIGLATPIFVAIFISKDFSNLTIRNKIIAGYSRPSIYVSTLIVSILIGWIIIVFYALCNLGFSSLFLGYSSFPQDSINVGKEVLYILRTLGLGMLIYAALMSILVLLNFSFKNMAGTIIVIIILQMFELIITTVLAVSGTNEILAFFNKLLISTQVNYLSETTLDIYIIISSVLKIILFNLAGILSFKKSDIK